MDRILRWTVLALIVGIVGVAPFLFFRAVYGHNKRLREVTPGLVYRSGQLTAEGFTDAVEQLHLKTIINLQDDFPDPDLSLSFLDRRTIKESDLCRQLGVRYVFIGPDLTWRKRVGIARPEAIEQFLAVMDDPDSYPVLIHCKAGLHRTGVMTAIYRMEYEGWTTRRALQELKANGFGEWNCTADNDYVMQYVLAYKARSLHQTGLTRQFSGE
jgi:protein tyrosine/serine phosphatase